MAGPRVAVLLLLAACWIQAARSELVIEDAQRMIDISTYRAVHTTKLTVRNDGKEPASTVLLCESSSLLDNAAVYEVGEDLASKLPLKWERASAVPGAPNGVACRHYTLPKPLEGGGGKMVLNLWGIFTRVLHPKPAQKRQADPPNVLYQDFAQLASPYRVLKQKTDISVGNPSVHAYTGPKAKKSGSKITYGPFTDTAPFASQPLSIHYENASPFGEVTELVREIEVSHWGNVYFEERYHLRNGGPKVVGEWSRYDLMTRPMEFARGAIGQLRAVLPPTAHSLYYRDGIGNISSSDTEYGSEAVTVALVPRYPLFGGWSTKFLFGWSLPLQDVVAKDPATGRMHLTALIGPSIREMVVDELTVRVVLPEGARDARVSTSMDLAEPPREETQVTYLDLMGRPVVVLRLKNVVQEMNVAFSVEYTYSPLGLLQKPLLLVAAFGLLFLVAIVLSRSSASLSSSPSEHAVVKQHAS